jgi:hypothetical protein
MGAWGPGIFEDDAAYDYTEAIEEDAYEFFRTSFETAIELDYLEYDDAHAVTVSAAYMDNLLNGTKYVTENEEDEDVGNVNLFNTLQKDLKVDDLKPLAVKALHKVLGKHSELNELWMENEELYPIWRKNIEDLVARLGGLRVA